MIYEKRQEKTLSSALFKNPTAEYRDAPFWAWNTKLDTETAEAQIEMFRDMGCGGFHMHPRCGLDTEYLSDAFMQAVRTCVDKAKEEGMLACLYDEDRYPSGTAGGTVTKNPEYGGVYLMMTPFRRETAKERVYGKEYLVAAYTIELNAENDLVSYEKTEEEKANYFAYCVPYAANTFYNGSPYLDMFNPKAVQAFISETYPRYKKAVGDAYGKNVKTIFTDEPCASLPGWFFYAYPFAGDHKTDIVLHWTHEFPKLYAELYGEDLLACLPEVLWARADGVPSPAKYRFFDMAAERFVSSYHDACGKRCEEDGLILTGHQNRENTLAQQTGIIIEMMRGLRAFGMPGFDMLYNSVELNTAKQAQSVAHQYGREGVMTELYGISSWDFDFRGYKYQGDWQAALGATLRVPHVSLMSLGGEAKRDYPASIAYQSPWYKDFRYITDHFARLNTALVRGEPIVRVAVIHPVETFWMHVGTSENARNGRERIDKIFADVTEWLLYGLMDFDFIAESLLPALWDGKKIGSMQYDAILVAGCETLRETTREALREFAKEGGKVIVAGDMPRYADGYKEAEPLAFAESTELSRESILSALEPFREIDICTDIRAWKQAGTRTDSYIYTLRSDGEDRWLFFASTKKMACVDCDSPIAYTVKVRGEYVPQMYDTLTGEIRQTAYDWKNGETHIPLSLYSLDSVLLKLEKGEKTALPAEKKKCTYRRETDFKGEVPYARTEPNVLLLDMCRFRLDGGETEPLEEILRVNNICRTRLGMPVQNMSQAQPWTVRETELHTLELFFTVRCGQETAGTHLCFEAADEIILNGENVPIETDGWYMDKAIHTVPLPTLRAGENRLTVRVPISEKKHAEALYLIGEFDVMLRGCESLLMPKTETIGFGDAAMQGLPFYGGSLRYTLPFSMERDGKAEILCSAYRGAAVKVYIDGVEKGLIVKAPYTLSAGNLTEGEHVCVLEVLGNRHNTLGALHNINTEVPWCTPYKWRAEPEEMSYGYHTHPFGILKSPIIRKQF